MAKALLSIQNNSDRLNGTLLTDDSNRFSAKCQQPVFLPMTLKRK